MSTADIAERLDTAQHDARAMPQLDPGLDVEDAYEVQHALLARRFARGEKLSGTKLGFTSKAKMAQMGVKRIIVGQLTDAMALPDGGTLELPRFVHPRVEPEVAFRLSRDVDPGEGLLGCVDAVAPGLEIIDSRYENFKFNLADVVADNCSAAAYVVGQWQPLPESLRDRSVELTLGDEVAAAGSTNAIMGDPLNALSELESMARDYDFPLTAGQVILAGSATEAAWLRPGAVRVTVAGLGGAGFEVVA